VRAQLPVPDATLATTTTARATMLSTFDTELAACMLKTDMDVTRAEMVVAADKLLTALARDNQDAVVARLRTVLNTHVTALREEFDRYCDASLPLTDESQLRSKFESLQSECMHGIQHDLDTLPDVDAHPDFAKYMTESKDGLDEFYRLKKIQNDSLLKDNEIALLRADALAAQEKLVEQNKILEQAMATAAANGGGGGGGGGTGEMEAELQRMRAKKESEEREAAALTARLAAQQRELEAIRKRKKGICVIL
jgi:hypothetical protein